MQRRVVEEVGHGTMGVLSVGIEWCKGGLLGRVGTVPGGYLAGRRVRLRGDIFRLVGGYSRY